MVDRTINYTLALNDNITPTANKATQSEEKLKTSIENTTQSMDSQNIEFIKNVESLSAMREGLGAVVGGVKTLGLVSEETGKHLDKMVAGVNIFVGTAQAIKGIVGIYEMLRSAEIALAAVETYRAVLKNPAMIGLAVTGLGIAGGVGGFFAARKIDDSGGIGGIIPGRGGGDSGGGTTVNQNITFQGGAQGTSGTNAAARTSLESTGDY